MTQIPEAAAKAAAKGLPDFQILSSGGDLFSPDADPAVFRRFAEFITNRTEAARMIPDEAAVEAARRVMSRGAYQMTNDELPYAHVARAALEAAAPHIRAQALRDAAKAFGECEPGGSYSSTPEQVMAWLSEYADKEAN